MSKNTFKAFVDTLTLLLNTPMVPPEENSQEMEVALTELPVSSRNSVSSNIFIPPNFNRS